VTEFGVQADRARALIGGRNFLFPVCGAKLLEEIRLGHSSAEQRPGIADVKNGVTGPTGARREKGCAKTSAH